MSSFVKLIIIRQRKTTTIFTHPYSTLSPPPKPSTPTSTVSHYDKLIREAGQARDLNKVKHLLTKRINEGCLNTKQTFNFITKTQTSLSLIDPLFTCLASLPKGLHRKNAFQSFIIRLCKLDLVYNALHLLEEMRKREIEMGSILFHPVIMTLTKKHDLETALRVFEVMKGCEVVPDVTSYNFVLTGCCLRGESKKAVEVLEKMKEGGVKGDSRTYDAMVLGACKGRKVDGAVSILRAAFEDGVYLLPCTYWHVIKLLLKEGCYEQAVKLVMCFAGRDRSVDVENFEILGNELVKAGRCKEAKVVVNEMVKRGLPVGQKLNDFHKLHAAS